jgi:hypothetical protein
LKKEHLLPIDCCSSSFAYQAKGMLHFVSSLLHWVSTHCHVGACMTQNSGHLRLFAFLLSMLALTSGQAQKDSTSSSFGGIVYLDSLVVSATRSGFSTEDFIELVQQDASFYQAFENIRLLAYESDNDIRFFDKKGKETARLNNRIRQNMKGTCRTMDILHQEVTGDYYKRDKSLRYFTANIYESVFFTYQRTCHTNKKRVPETETEKQIEKLKVLIFKPGTAVDVPVVGKKARIFSPALQSCYDYAITSKKYRAETDCYVFSVQWKKNLTKRAQQKTIIRQLETYFDKSTFEVVARSYDLFYNGSLIDFDVRIVIELIKVGGQYLPGHLHLEGEWDIPFNDQERVLFDTKFYYENITVHANQH